MQENKIRSPGIERVIFFLLIERVIFFLFYILALCSKEEINVLVRLKISKQ